MKWKNELEFCIKVLRNMQINSHIINRSAVNHDIEKTFLKLINITGQNTVNLITDELTNNYIMFILPSSEAQNIFICGPFKEKETVTAIISALAETIWGTGNFRIKKHLQTDGILSESKNDYSILRYPVHIQEAISIVESDLTADLSLKAVASLLGMNSSYLSMLFRKETGITFTDFVNTKRIEHAKQQLLSSPLQIQAVAQNCGILDVNYFTKLFKKYTGVTPGKFRTKS